jgi:hypothetical protein
VTRALAVVLLLGACGDKLPARPNEASFRAAGPTEKCKLTAPRAMRCADELMVAELRSLAGGDDGGLADAVAEDLKKDPKPTTKKDRRVMHEHMCLGGPSYADAVFACWSEASCNAFAQCVMNPAAPPPTSP